MIRVGIKLADDALCPRYASDEAAGADLLAQESVSIAPGTTTLVGTGVFLEMPKGLEAQIRPRSSLGLKGLIIPNTPGTIDSDYRGEIKVILMNLGPDVIEIRRGEGLAQLVFKELPEIQFEYIQTLSKTKRGEGGFGSTNRT